MGNPNLLLVRCDQLSTGLWHSLSDWLLWRCHLARVLYYPQVGIHFYQNEAYWEDIFSASGIYLMNLLFEWLSTTLPSLPVPCCPVPCRVRLPPTSMVRWAEPVGDGLSLLMWAALYPSQGELYTNILGCSHYLYRPVGVFCYTGIRKLHESCKSSNWYVCADDI